MPLGNADDNGATTLKRWLPHLLMLALILAASWLVLRVFAPLARPILVAAAIAALTHRVVLIPVSVRVDRWLPRIPMAWRKRVAAATAVTLLLLTASAPILLILIDTFHDVGQLMSVIAGLVVRDAETAHTVAEALAAHATRMQELYPAFPITGEQVRSTLLDLLLQSQASDFYGFLFRGTGSILVQTLLVVFLVFAFFERGGPLVDTLLRLAPFTAGQRQELVLRFQHITLRLLNDIVAMSALRGLALGLVAWLTGGFNPLVVGAIAGFVGLVPVVGYPSIWIPLAGILWSRGDTIGCVALAIGSLASWWLVGQLGRYFVRELKTRDAWPGFLLFLALIGGVLSFGWAGLVVGPMAVVVLRVLLGFWLPLYGIGQEEADDDADATASQAG